jgi:hypothetical protein
VSYHFTGLLSTEHYQVLSKALVDIAKDLYICTVFRSMLTIQFDHVKHRLRGIFEIGWCYAIIVNH